MIWAAAGVAVGVVLFCVGFWVGTRLADARLQTAIATELRFRPLLASRVWARAFGLDLEAARDDLELAIEAAAEREEGCPRGVL